MGLWDDIKGGVGDAYGAYDKYMWGGILPGNDPSEEGRTLTDEDRRRFLEFAAQQQGGTPVTAGVSDFRDDQRDLMGRLRALSEGRGPSLAQENLRQGVDRATSQQYAMAAGARGNPALAQRQAMNQAGSLQSQAAGQGAMARAAEQLGAMSQMGQHSAMSRGQDEALEMFNAGQFNSTRAAQDALRLRALQSASGATGMFLEQPTSQEQSDAQFQAYLSMLAKIYGGGG